MSEGVWISLITAAAAIASAWLARDAKKATREQAKAVAEVRHEVKNSHSENLRVNLDREFARVHSSLGGMHDDIRQLRADDSRQREDVADLRREVPRMIAEHTRSCPASREPNG